jgi:hypothetical protein
LDDLLGWQWLLAELGQPRRLGELAVQAGLLAASTAELLGQGIQHRERSPSRMPPIVLPVEAVALGA